MKMNRDIKSKNTMRNHFLRKFLRTIFTAGIWTVSTVVYGQTDTTTVVDSIITETTTLADTTAFMVKGIVLDATTGQPVVAAQVRSKSHKTAATTDEQGNFAIEVSSPGEVLIIVAFDYNLCEVLIRGRTSSKLIFIQKFI